MTSKYAAFFHHFTDAVAVLSKEGNVIYINPAFQALLGKNGCDATQRAHFGAIVGMEKNAIEPLLHSVRNGKPAHVEWTIKKADGHLVLVKIVFSPIINEQGEADAVLCVCRDVTKEKKLEQALEEYKQRFQLIAEHSTDYILIFSNRRELLYTPSSHKKANRANRSRSYKDIFQFVHPDDLPNIRRKFDELYHTYDTQIAEFRKRDRDGKWVWMEAQGKAIVNEQNELDYVIVTVKNIGERKEYEEKLRQLAYFDSLTGIANRSYFEQYVKQLIESQTVFALCYLDFDKFKWINDHFSHQAGDYFLQEAVKRVQSVLRAEDFFARIGGDEFVLLLPNRSKEEVTKLADKLVQAFHQPFYYEKQLIQSTISMGIAFFPKDSDRIEQVMKYADQALYNVKKRGKNGYEFYLPTQNRRESIEQELPFAIVREQFYLCYQPKIKLESGATMGVETLLRWRHPSFGEIPPFDFIPLAEESGFIFEITLWVLEHACRQVKEWQSRFPELKLAVNLSPFLLNRMELIQHITDILHDTKFVPEYLILEVTESGLMENIETGKHILAELKHIGVQVAIDDFGTGFSSLACIRNLPVSLLKIDRSFIQGIAENSKDATIVDTIIHLAKSLDIQVLAEGVETHQQVVLLQQMDCDFAQGYYFSKSLEAEKLQQWLEEHN